MFWSTEQINIYLLTYGMIKFLGISFIYSVQL